MKSLDRVVERVVLASRVAERSKRADSFGDPGDLLAQFKRAVAKYAEKEAMAKKYVEAFAEVTKLQAEGAPAEKIKAVRENALVQTIEESQDGKRRKERDLSYEITTHSMQHGWGKIQDVAQNLCWAILQQLVLPPKPRKAIEAIAKFYARTPRFSTRGRTYEEARAKAVQIYLDFLEDFRKQEKVFEIAISQGKQHAGEGEGATRFKAGPFTLVNSGGFSTEQMQNIAKLAEEAAQKMAGIGLGKVNYGDIILSNRIERPNWAAFYVVAKDEMFIRADSKVNMDTVRVLCHELTHRLEHKFLQGKEHEISQLYSTINTHTGFMSETELPAFGASVPYKGEPWKVIERDTRRRSVKLAPANPLRCFVCAEKGRAEHEPDEEHKFPIARRETIVMPAAMFFKLNGVEQKVDPLDFITGYAKKGGPGENFAEMVSFYAIGKLPKEQLDLLLPILS
jgi:hypothetical protein